MNGRRGADCERRARKVLEACGFVVVRSAASKGVIDLVAWNGQALRLLQIKRNGYVSAIERQALELLPRPPGASVEIWRFVSRRRDPIIEVL